MEYDVMVISGAGGLSKSYFLRLVPVSLHDVRSPQVQGRIPVMMAFSGGWKRSESDFPGVYALLWGKKIPVSVTCFRGQRGWERIRETLVLLWPSHSLSSQSAEHAKAPTTLWGISFKPQ